jgi:transcriptional regulator with XRE-family HTH domain
VNIGKMIRDQRLRRKMTQAQLATAAGLTWEHVSRIETGKHVPFKATLRRLCIVLRLPMPK